MPPPKPVSRTPVNSSNNTLYILVARFGLSTMLCFCTLWLVFAVRHYQYIRQTLRQNKNYSNNNNHHHLASPTSTLIQSSRVASPQQGQQPVTAVLPLLEWRLPHAFDNVLYRAQEVQSRCASWHSSSHGKQNNDKPVVFDNSTTMPFLNNETVATLPAFGILQDIVDWKEAIRQGRIPDAVSADERRRNEPHTWQCTLPSRKECRPTHFSVVFMAYNPDRLKITLEQIQIMLTAEGWTDLVKTIVLVWNGPRAIEESAAGRDLLQFQQAHADQFSIAYPLKMGFPNDLMNRYHPRVVENVTTKAILYYDDDGPFYSLAAIQAGFELWKRHASAQIGAMARQIDYGPRQHTEYNKLTAGGTKHNDRLFVSHCDNLPSDVLEYNYKYFANYDANMVLPSGSFLHANYLCFLWHPVLERVRKFVRDHPAHPDDMTVSWIVSQLAGRAPRVYSRRLKAAEDDQSIKQQRQRQRFLLSQEIGNETQHLVDASSAARQDAHYDEQRLRHHRRRNLMLNINWDAGAGMTDAKRYWAALRSVAVNSLARYFGSINSGSIGWCEGTKYYNSKVPGKCDPAMARQGWLPWMIDDYEHSC